MKKPSKKKVVDFLETFKKLPEASQDKLFYIAYGMQLAAGTDGGSENDRTAGSERMARFS